MRCSHCGTRAGPAARSSERAGIALVLKRALAGQIPIDKATMDINGDGVVNSRDLIDLIRSVRAQARENLKPAVSVPRR